MNGRYQPLRHHDPDAEPAEINLAPMIDILFILLIFFLVTSSFVRESGVQVDRPGAVSAAQMEAAAILIAIRPDGEIWVFDEDGPLLRAEDSNGNAISMEYRICCNSFRLPAISNVTWF